MTNTENLNLNLIEEHDLLDFALFNENANILDSAVSALQTEAEKIPTMEEAITGLNNNMTTAENDIVALGNRAGALEGDVSDIQTVDTNQNTRITALETKSEKFYLNGVQLDNKNCKSFIVTDVTATLDPYDMYRYIVRIPMSNFGDANAVKVISAELYNDGLTIYGASLGATLLRATVRDNNLECVFVSNTNFAVDGATAVITAIGY